MSSDNNLNLNELKFHHGSFDANKKIYKTYLFFHKDKFYKALSEDTDSIMNCLPKDSSEIQSFKKTEHTLNINLSYKVYELKHYPHILFINFATKLQRKEILISLINFQKKLLKNNLCAFDVHEFNFGITLDGFKFLDHDAIAKTTDKLNNDRYDIYAYVKTCYLICKYIKNYNIEYDSFNYANLKELEPDLAGSDINESTVVCEQDYNNLINFINKLNFEADTSHWSDHYPYNFEWLNSPDTYPKIGSLNKLLKSISYNTALDIACNKGLYTFLIGKYSKSTFGFDLDEKCINYCDLYNKKEYNCLFGHIYLDSFFESKNIAKIYKSELVTALALVHHLKMQNIRSDKFCELLSELSEKYILIEDIDSSEEYEKELLKLNFKLIDRLPSSPEGRTLSLFEKIII